MTALSLIQPWATLVAIGAKRLETRDWATAYRGPLAIHASKGFPTWARETCFESPFAEALRVGGYETPEALPLGAIVAVVDLVRIVRTEAIGMELAVPAVEEAFGDFRPQRFAWVLDDVRVVTPPIAAKGARGIWTAPPDVAHLVALHTEVRV